MKYVNLVQLIFTAFLCLGFFIGMVPLMYLLVFWWVIPLAIVNLVLSIIQKNGTLPFTITNVVLGIMGMIPILGLIATMVGVVVSVVTVVRLARCGILFMK